MIKCELCNKSITNARDKNAKVCLDCALKLNDLGYVKLKNVIDENNL